MSRQQTPAPAPEIYPLGDSAIVLRFGETISRLILQQIKSITSCLDAHPFDGMIEYVPAYTTLTIFYNPWIISGRGKYDTYEKVSDTVQEILEMAEDPESASSRHIEIPVCYDKDFGPDLEFVARHNQLTPEEVISIHTRNEYLVYMIGFAPGFPYLGGMDKKIAAPRKSNPRITIPQGSVGIAGEQTGIYPIETPGGWQLIGCTPLPLFRPEAENPGLLQAGDSIRFVRITTAEFLNQKEAYRGA